MSTQSPTVAVLLATYNGARYVEQQIASLKENQTAFVLHWLDDHSTDDTRTVVRNAAALSGVELREWHQPQHEGVPKTFFRLLECVEADIYLYCDQDDVWQPGKIDAVVADLTPDLHKPVLCFADFLTWREGQPLVPFLTRMRKLRGSDFMKEPRWFIQCPAFAHTMGFTRPIRDTIVRHIDVVREYAFMHDRWTYLIAHAVGTCRLLPEVPTTLYRLHGENTFGLGFKRSLRWQWDVWQDHRRGLAVQAIGFQRLVPFFPPSAKLTQMAAAAKLVEKIPRWHSPFAYRRLLRSRVMMPSKPYTMWIAIRDLSMLLTSV